MAVDPTTLAKERQTSLGLYVTAKEAYDMWQADPEGVRLLDVRSPEEYVFVGHAPMAWNIPLAFQSFEWDPQKKAFHWDLNPGFLPAVQAWADTGDTLLVSCRSGGRSAMAINALAKAGYPAAWNIVDGMEGRPGQGPRQRLRRHAHEERLEELRPALDLRRSTGSGWCSRSARVTELAGGQRGRLTETPSSRPPSPPTRRRDLGSSAC